MIASLRSCVITSVRVYCRHGKETSVLCECSNLDWRDVDQTAQHHPECRAVPNFRFELLDGNGSVLESAEGVGTSHTVAHHYPDATEHTVTEAETVPKQVLTSAVKQAVHLSVGDLPGAFGQALADSSARVFIATLGFKD